MIILDTNVVSELMRPRPEPAVLSWLDAIVDDVVTTAITVAEIRHGIARLPHGRRRSALTAAADRTFAPLEGHVLPFDALAALEYADAVADRERSGFPVSALDAQIAAIARDRSAALATRNVRDFAGTGVEVVDPWSTPPRARD